MASEYVDLENMMAVANLVEKETEGDYFTWSNKQDHCTIYSRIDRAFSTPTGSLNFLTSRFMYEKLGSLITHLCTLKLLPQDLGKFQNSSDF